MKICRGEKCVGRMTRKERVPGGSAGFTLIEVMIAMVISSLVVAGLYMAFRSQQKASMVQQNVVELQQNARVAIQLLGEQLWMAGYDPESKAGSGFIWAQRDRVGFTADLDGDGRINIASCAPNSCGADCEVFYFGLPDADDANADGVVDGGNLSTLSQGCRRGTTPGNTVITGGLPLVEGVEAVEFSYILGNGNTINNDGVLNVANSELDNIRAVQVSIIVRERQADLKYSDSHTYAPLTAATTSGNIDGNGNASPALAANARPAPWGGPADRTQAQNQFHRRVLLTRIQCRNMGLVR